MAQPDPTAKAIQTGAKLVGNVLREVLVSRKEREMAEKRAEAQKEVLDMKHGAVRSVNAQQAQGQTQTDPDDPLSQASKFVQDYDDLLAKAEQKEDCDFCKSLIAEVRSRPVEEQRVLLPELQAFLAEAKQDADRDELVRTIKNNERLSGLVESALGMPSSGGDQESARSAQTKTPKTDSDGNVIPNGDGTAQTRLN